MLEVFCPSLFRICQEVPTCVQSCLSNPHACSDRPDTDQTCSPATLKSTKATLKSWFFYYYYYFTILDHHTFEYYMAFVIFSIKLIKKIHIKLAITMNLKNEEKNSYLNNAQSTIEHPQLRIYDICIYYIILSRKGTTWLFYCKSFIMIHAKWIIYIYTAIIIIIFFFCFGVLHVWNAFVVLVIRNHVS